MASTTLTTSLRLASGAEGQNPRDAVALRACFPTPEETRTCVDSPASRLLSHANITMRTKVEAALSRTPNTEGDSHPHISAFEIGSSDG